MTDRNVQFPNRFRLVPVPGTNGIYDIEPVPGDVLDEGTLLNKANLFADPTGEEIFGDDYTGDQTVNDALFALSTKPAPINVYASDFWLYITGRHPALCSGLYSDLAYWEYMSIPKELLARDISLIGNAQTITIYDKGGN